MARYEIAGLILDFFPDFAHLPIEFESYASTLIKDPDSEIYIRGHSEIIQPQGNQCFEDFIRWYPGSGDRDGYTAYIPGRDNPHEFISEFSTDKTWSHISLNYLKGIPGIGDAVVRFVGNIILRNLIILHEGLMLHASAIKWANKGILFSAPSGTGKSTQAALWETFRGAQVLNDDTPVLIKLSDEQITVHGTPWSGSNMKHMNSSAPIAAIIVLEQSHENRMRRLMQQELTSRLLPRFLLPYHDNYLMDLALKHFAKIAASVPVYLLECRPDREAVELVYEYVNHHDP